MLYPQAAEKTFLLREFDETLDLFEKDISDPIGGCYEVYLNCRDQIEQGIVSLLRFIERSEGGGGPAGARHATVALGADHGGYDLKEALKEHSGKRGHQCRRFGHQLQGTQRLPRLRPGRRASVVSQHKAEFGVLVCTTGVGMSIAANKVPGVRAALISDEDTAALARTA